MSSIIELINSSATTTSFEYEWRDPFKESVSGGLFNLRLNSQDNLNFVKSFFQEARSLIKEKNFEDARMVIKRGMDLSPDSEFRAKFKRLEAKIFRNEGDFLKAQSSAKEGRQTLIMPGSKLEAQLYYEEIRALFLQGKTEKAASKLNKVPKIHLEFKFLELFTSCLDNIPMSSAGRRLALKNEILKDEFIPDLEAKLFYEKAIFFCDEGKYQLANAAARDGLNACPQSSELEMALTYALIQSLHGQNKSPEAQKLISQKLSQNPDNVNLKALYSLNCALDKIEEGELDAAKQILRMGYYVNPTNRSLIEGLNQTRLEIEKKLRADQRSKKESDPEETKLLINLRWMKEDMLNLSRQREMQEPTTDDNTDLEEKLLEIDMQLMAYNMSRIHTSLSPDLRLSSTM